MVYSPSLRAENQCNMKIFYLLQKLWVPSTNYATVKMRQPSYPSLIMVIAKTLSPNLALLTF